MTQVKLTKNELRSQQHQLAQLEKYLPTLKLKKSMLQSVVADARAQLTRLQIELERAQHDLQEGSTLLSMAPALEVESYTQLLQLRCERENVAGVEVPLLQAVELAPASYLFSQTPVWLDSFIDMVRQFKTLLAESQVAQERLNAFEREMSEVSIRVNLFEKVLIPRALSHIKRIKIFLQDQELASVGRAKVAKSKHQELSEEPDEELSIL